MHTPFTSYQDEVLTMIDAEVSRGGVMVLLQKISDTEGPGLKWVVTVGMVQYGISEIIIFGVEPDIVATVVDHILSELENDVMPVHVGTLPDSYFSRPVFGDRVTGPLVDRYAMVINDYYELKQWSAPQIVQWVVSDREGRFPWNETFDPEMRNCQVLLLDGLSA